MSWAFPAFGKVQADRQALCPATDAGSAEKKQEIPQEFPSGVRGGRQSPLWPQDKGNGSWALMFPYLSLAQPASGPNFPASQR